MLSPLLFTTAALAAITGLAVSLGNTDATKAAEAVQAKVAAAAGAQVMVEATQAGQCLRAGGASCVSGEASASPVTIKRVARLLSTQSVAYSAVVSGCASSLNRSITWESRAVECPWNAYTVLLALPRTPGTADSAGAPFRTPASWFYNAAVPGAPDNVFSGVAALREGTKTSEFYVWARTFTP